MLSPVSPSGIGNTLRSFISFTCERRLAAPEVQVYYRDIDPTPICEFVMKDWNDIASFGGAVCFYYAIV
ncbi:MAG: hypothetical protein IKC87_05190 [Clostridia bacterium]|nr:hypothetical protein [Clostridia bacterium]